MNLGDILKQVDSYDVQANVISKVKDAGFIIPPKPLEVVQGINIVTEWNNIKKKYGDISKIPYSTLGEYLDKWTEMISYIRWIESVADLEFQSSREIKEMMRKQLYTIQEGNREMKDAMVYVNKDFIESNNQFIQNQANYIAVKGLRESYEQRANAISREITRRGAELSDTSRASNRR